METPESLLWVIKCAFITHISEKLEYSIDWVSLIRNSKIRKAPKSKIFFEFWHDTTNGKFQSALGRLPGTTQASSYANSCNMWSHIPWMGLWHSVSVTLSTVITVRPTCITRCDYSVFCVQSLLCGVNILLKMSKRPVDTPMGN